MELEHGKPPEEIKVPELKHPSREEYRRVLKTGTDAEGHPVHPQDLKDLRKATIADLKAFGGEVNTANANLKSYVDKLAGEHQWTLLNLIAYLIDKKILPENADKDFAEYMATSKETVAADMAMAREFLAKKQQEDSEKDKTIIPEILKPGEVTPKPLLKIVSGDTGGN
jgi:hypothetical protein